MIARFRRAWCARRKHQWVLIDHPGGHFFVCARCKTGWTT
jgi:hypothetical protein